MASKAGGKVKMPDGGSPVRALSWKEVEGITNRFDSLSPYNRKIVPHLLRLTDENYDKNGNQRQLFGLPIAAKRYALYTTKCRQPHCKHRQCVTIVDPKAHGLIFFAPGEDRENGLPKWWWELWRFLLALEFNWLDEKFYREQIQPRFARISVATMMSALAVSEPYATNIRAGRCIPHPRHWLALARLVGFSEADRLEDSMISLGQRVTGDGR